MNGRSHVIRHVLTLRIFDAPKKLCFWRVREEVFNQLNSASELSCTRAMCRNHGMRSFARVTQRGHVQGACKLPGIICIQKQVELYNADSSRVKRRCQLVVRLKANKCYQELLHYLSSYINFLNIRLFAWVLGLCVIATDNVTTYRFFVIVLLTISL